MGRKFGFCWAGPALPTAQQSPADEALDAGQLIEGLTGVRGQAQAPGRSVPLLGHRMEVGPGVVGREADGDATGRRHATDTLQDRPDHPGTGQGSDSASIDQATPFQFSMSVAVGFPSPSHIDHRPDRPTVGSADAGDVEEAAAAPRSARTLGPSIQLDPFQTLDQRGDRSVRADVVEGDADRHALHALAQLDPKHDVVAARAGDRDDVPPRCRRSPTGDASITVPAPTTASVSDARRRRALPWLARRDAGSFHA